MNLFQANDNPFCSLVAAACLIHQRRYTFRPYTSAASDKFLAPYFALNIQNIKSGEFHLISPLCYLFSTFVPSILGDDL